MQAIKPMGILHSNCKVDERDPVIKLSPRSLLPHTLPYPNIPQRPFTMADRRPEVEDRSRVKRQKTAATEMDPKENPYLAHMYNAPAIENGYSNGYEVAKPRSNGSQQGTVLSKFPRHATDAAMAKRAEDGPNNPFNGKPLSKQYFAILKTRRNLPVHAQR